jgi:hypothetical protein
MLQMNKNTDPKISILFLRSLLIAACLMACPITLVRAADLDDSIESELDNSLSDDSSSTKPAAPAKEQKTVKQDTAKNEAPVVQDGDDIKLDEGEPAAAPPVTEEPKIEPPVPVVTEEKAAPQVSTSSGVHIDPPNLQLEKKFYNQSHDYQQISDLNWDEVVGSRKTEAYRMQTGDSLWDLSQTFFGDGAYWAKLWSQNGGIENPHFVKNGKMLRFVSGTEADGPAFGLAGPDGHGNMLSLNVKFDPVNERPSYKEQVESEISQEELDAGNIIENEEIIAAPELPPALQRPPVLQTLPRSFAAKNTALSQIYDTSGFSAGAPSTAATSEPPKSLLTSIIFDRVPQSYGKVQEIEIEDEFASTGKFVIVKLNGPVAPGTRFTAVRVKDKLGPGVVAELNGVISISGPLSEKKNIYRASVIASPSPIYAGDVLIAEAPPIVYFSKQGRRAEHELKILGGEFDKSRLLFGISSIVYLNGGNDEGVHAGDIVGVQSLRRVHKAKSEFPNLERPTGTLRIVDSRDHVSTAVVVESYEELRVGDMTGGELPTAAPDLRVDTPVEIDKGFSAPQSSAKEPSQDKSHRGSQGGGSEGDANSDSDMSQDTSSEL